MDTTLLFTGKASDYSAYRPSYPQEVYDELLEKVPTPASAVDIAAGTGIFAKGLISNGYFVKAVEPNPSMRDELKKSSLSSPFEIIAGTAESTGLPSESTDLITIAQAFHWVDPEKAREEFIRIGTRKCLTAVVWNSRNFIDTSFMQDYKSLLDNYAPNYLTMKTHWSNLDNRVKEFFHEKFCFKEFPNIIPITEEEMIGNLLSLSYAPPTGTAEQSVFIDKAKDIFAKHQVKNKVEFNLTTRVYTGKIS